MEKVVNLTPHEIVIVRGAFEQADGKVDVDYEQIRIPPSGTVARVKTVDEDAGTLDVLGTPVPVVRRKFGEIEGLPEPEEGVIYLVSLMVLEAVKARGGRDDVFAPDTTVGVIRDEEGRIKAVTRLVAAK